MFGLRKSRVLTALLGAVLLAGVAVAPAAADDTTAARDTLRTGWDTTEPGLAPSVVSAPDFGQLFASQLDGQVYAQPIVANGTLVAATENNKVYGLDPKDGKQKWSVNLGPAWPAATLSCGDLLPNIGVTSAPVYDPATRAVYVSAKVASPDAQHPRWDVHALDATTGAERPGFPRTISGAPTNNPGVPFNSLTAMQRPGLLLLDGVVYMGFASHCDHTPYVGYIVGVNSDTGRQTTMWSTEAAASDEGGIWQGGSGLVSDGPGRIEVATGNGVAPAPGPGDVPPTTLGESVVRLAVNGDGSLTARSFFSPHDNAKLNQDDADVGSGGPTGLPAEYGSTAHPHLMVQVGKDGRVWLLDADHLGGAAQGPGGTDNAVDMAGPFAGVWGHPGFWGDADRDGGYVYVVGNNGPLRALRYDKGGAHPSLTPVGNSVDNFGYTSGSPLVTSDGDNPGSALVWVVYSTGPNGANAQLRAYDPVPQNGLMKLRYSAPIGTAVKFTQLATDNGRVYVGTRDGKVLGFGRPTTALFANQAQDFGRTAVGSTGTATVSLTANQNLTVRGVSTTAPFTVGSVGQTPLTKGQHLDIPVQFTPTTWGGATGTLNIDTDAGPAAIDLHGTGTQRGLGADPATVDFGQVRTGAAKKLGVTIVNTGTAQETITGSTAPNAPFTADLPATGAKLGPGASLVVPVTYTPTDGTESGRQDSSSLVVAGDAGTVTVPITGTALTGQSQLTLDPPVLDFGIVQPGKSATLTFEVSNTGTVPLNITKAKAPAGVFSDEHQVSEGQVLSPGDELQQTVKFTPTDAYPASAGYLITADDGHAATTVQLLGNQDPVGAYYQQLGGSRGSYLSDPVGPEYQTAGGGMAQDYRGGSIYWSPASGAHAVRGDISGKYRALGGPGGVLGYPVTDELTTPDGIGRYTHFNGSGGASVYWTQKLGAHAIYGAIRTKWSSLGWERSVLGYPTTDETAAPDGVGRYNHFSGTGGASIYWTPKLGAHAVYGAIRAKWATLGWERSRLGYPSTDEFAITGGRRSNFAGGWIAWTSARGTVTVGYN